MKFVESKTLVFFGVVFGDGIVELVQICEIEL
jgi:hypothetical protein